MEFNVNDLDWAAPQSHLTMLSGDANCLVSPERTKAARALFEEAPCVTEYTMVKTIGTTHIYKGDDTHSPEVLACYMVVDTAAQTVDFEADYRGDFSHAYRLLQE